MYIKAIIVLFLALTVTLNARDTVYYYGVNGKPVEEPGKAIEKITVTRSSASRYRVQHSLITEKGPQRIRTERIRVTRDGTLKIRYREETVFSKRYMRHIEEVERGLYRFTEERAGQIMRTGYTTSPYHLHLEGEVTEYYPGGAIKSISTYNNNLLVSNRNYYPDGTEYIHDIFYSTDQPATYSFGDEFFRRFVMSRVEQVDLPEMNQRIIIGAVVMENGELSGIRVLEGSVPSVNTFFRETIEMLPGQWEPARLQGETVRSFIQIPFNLSSSRAELRYLHLTKNGQLLFHD
ncbi:MAG: hypothetical protein EA408_09770 [Marinilabiliales bacterium]|nr:MAG: hypothetical protein EA408_09770 [Marinilabiliales bacterium]